MAPVMKETLKFGLVTLFCVGVVVAACFVVQPYGRILNEARRAELVRLFVPGEAMPRAERFGDESGQIDIYHLKAGKAVVFARTHLFLRDMDLALLVDGDKVVSMLDTNPGMPPYNPGLRSLFLAGTDGNEPVSPDTLKNPGSDVVGGATVDFVRLSAVLERVVGFVRKAGSK